jgi:hypothetical protein
LQPISKPSNDEDDDDDDDDEPADAEANDDPLNPKLNNSRPSVEDVDEVTRNLETTYGEKAAKAGPAVPFQPAPLNIYKSCCYKAALTVPAGKEPIKATCELLRKMLKEIQSVVGTQVFLKTWDHREQAKTYKSKKDLPSGQSPLDLEVLTALFGGYLTLPANKHYRMNIRR